MKQKTREYLIKVETLLEAGRIHINMFDDLLDEWSILIDGVYSQKQTAKQVYLSLNQLKFTTKWFEKQHCSNKNKQLQDFIHYLVDYVDIEIKGLHLHPEKEMRLGDANQSKKSDLHWTANKRGLIELICALKEVKCINEGKLPFQRLVVLFEEVFNINLGNIHSELNKMSLRKSLDDRLQQAYFMNKLAQKFNHKMLKK